MADYQSEVDALLAKRLERLIWRAIGVRIRQVRGQCTQEKFAEKLQVHVNTLARYERGHRFPTLEFLKRLSDQGINLHWLVTGKGERYIGSDNPQREQPLPRQC